MSPEGFARGSWPLPLPSLVQGLPECNQTSGGGCASILCRVGCLEVSLRQGSRDPDWVLGHGSEPEGPNPCPGGAAVQRPGQAAALAKEEMARDLGLSRGRESHGIWRCIFSGESQ